MSDNRRRQVHFDANLGGTRGWRGNSRFNDSHDRRGKKSRSDLAEVLYRSKYGDEDEDEMDFMSGYLDDDLSGFEEMKVLRKKKGIKAISSGKVLNTGRKKYRRWRRHDKDVLKDMLTPGLNEMIADGTIKKRRAKKVRKQFIKRVLSCFYAKDKKD